MFVGLVCSMCVVSRKADRARLLQVEACLYVTSASHDDA
jgi:hypothetical protein